MALRTHHLLSALADSRFRRLFRVRLAGQFGDGVFQASLAGAVLFDPQHAGHAADVAAAFAVLLLPYSLIGPFAGVFIDRWWRRRVLAVANAVRSVAVLGVAAELAAGVTGAAFYASGLVVISISRFVLSKVTSATAVMSLLPFGETLRDGVGHGPLGGRHELRPALVEHPLC